MELFIQIIMDIIYDIFAKYFQILYDILSNAYEQYISALLLYLPLSFIGIWRWGWWLFKKVRGLFYKPYNNDYNAKVSVVIPVYKEDPIRFRNTLNSILANEPYEVICVIDEEDAVNISIARRIGDQRVKVIVTREKGKRKALAKGILESRGDIIALIDSDVIWLKDTLRNSIKPFIDRSIVGVCTRQNVINRNNAWAILTDIFWDSRNYDDLPAMAISKALSCLSGRTAFWRREFLINNIDEFLNERIFGVRKESGEDKCWTRLAQRQGYKVYFQSNAQIYSYAAEDFRKFVSQRVRWSRNTFNSDIRSLCEGWAFKKPFLAAMMLDRFVSIFTILVSPTVFGLAVFMQHVDLAFIILALWLGGRSIKHIQHLKHKPKDIVYIPLYIFANFLVAFIKLYALITITEQKSIRGENKPIAWKHYLGVISVIAAFGAYILLFIMLRGVIG